MVSKEPNHILAPSISLNQEKNMTVRSVLLNRDSPDIETRLKRRRNRTQQVRFKDQVDGAEESPRPEPGKNIGFNNTGPAVIVEPDQGPSSKPEPGPKRGPRKPWSQPRPSSLTLPNPRKCCMSTAIQTSPSLQKQFPTFRFRSKSLGDFGETEDPKAEPEEGTLFANNEVQHMPGKQCCQGEGAMSQVSEPQNVVRHSGEGLADLPKVVEHRSVKTEQLNPTSESMKAPDANRSESEQCGEKVSKTALLNSDEGPSPGQNQRSEATARTVFYTETPANSHGKPKPPEPASEESQPQTLQGKAELSDRTIRTADQPGGIPLMASQSETLKQVHELLELVAEAKGQIDLAKMRGGLLTQGGQKEGRPPAGNLEPGSVQPMQHEISNLQSRLQSMEDVLETSQQTIKVLLDVIQDLEKKEAIRDG
ncbi:F196A protein, partial [Polyodon spathula]|nr:F196A protein [Polyodon spathula]